MRRDVMWRGAPSDRLLSLQEPARIAAYLKAFYKAQILAQNHWDG
jgi:hypothetical protein